jgi:hypothetical protein
MIEWERIDASLNVGKILGEQLRHISVEALLDRSMESRLPLRILALSSMHLFC